MPSPLSNLVARLPLLFLLLAGCGTALQRQGTEQLLLSDSVDRAIDQLDLSGLAGRKVYLDTEYMKTFKGSNIYINSDYMISALRQKMTTSGLRVETTRTEADYILEARVGALGTDTMEVTYGIPSSNGIGAAANAVSGVPVMPVIPEMSFGKRNGAVGISKVVVYAYHRDTGVPVWQSGAAVARSDSRDSWLLGVGPLTQGSVYEGPTLAGNRINPPFGKKNTRQPKRPLTIADRQQYVHPAVLERQLADAKAATDKAVEQASQNVTPADPAVGSAVEPAVHEKGSEQSGSTPVDATSAPPAGTPPAPAAPAAAATNSAENPATPPQGSAPATAATPAQAMPADAAPATAPPELSPLPLPVFPPVP
jgi:hypothetical protein